MFRLLFLQYHGKLSFGARDKTITNFADNPNVRVLLASLRCGGCESLFCPITFFGSTNNYLVGLNLTMASRVIVLDPWWNSAAEQQAFCRVFRFGQTETTFLTRFCIQNTVDERLIEMQKRKQTEIEFVFSTDALCIPANLYITARLWRTMARKPRSTQNYFGLTC